MIASYIFVRKSVNPFWIKQWWQWAQRLLRRSNYLWCLWLQGLSDCKTLESIFGGLSSFLFMYFCFSKAYLKPYFAVFPNKHIHSEDMSMNSSVQFSHSVVSDSLRPRELQHTRPPCPSPTFGVHPNSCPSSRWCHPAILSSVVPFSSCPQSLPASESFPMSQLFAWGGQSIGVSALASVLPKTTQDWSPLEWTGWISLQSKGLSRVFSNKTVQKHQFFSVQLSLQSNSHIHTWPLEKP